jgi:DNA helicase II / ATP-dependent DNA helicase PcrA
VPVLTPAQARVVEHPGGPLLVAGGAGTGKTTALVERFARLVASGLRPESVLTLAAAPAAVARLRTLLEDRVHDAYEELAVHTVHDVCARLLHDEALEVGLDPFVAPLGRADRLAMLLEHLDELPLREHDLGASPAALMSRVVARIDRLKEELVDAERFAAWARDADRPREREFAQLYLAHERLLAASDGLDAGDLVLRALRLLRERPHVRARMGARHRHLLVDDLQDLSPAALLLVEELARGTAGGAGTEGNVCACADADQALPTGAGARANVTAFRRSHPDAPVVRLERTLRCPSRVVTAAEAVIEPIPGRPPRRLEAAGEEPGEVRFWRCANERAQAQGVAAEVERLIRAGTPPGEIAVLVRSVRAQGRAIGLALEERALPHRLLGVDAFFGAPEVRDLLAWLRLLVDPSDAAAVVRALSRPPIELGSVDLARCVQIARRRRLDMVAGLVAANESPQIPPESRERIQRFLKLLRAAAAGLDTMRPDLFVHRLIDRLGLRRQQLFTAQSDVVERLVMLSRFAEMAAAHVRRAPQATPREFARYAAAVADAGLGDEEAGAAGAVDEAVRIVSMASAATLEADHVVLCGLESTRLPGTRRAEADPVPAALAPPQAAAAAPEDPRAAHVADMRRLTHLAMTRARRTLTLSYAERSDQDAPRSPSPFLEEARAALGAQYVDVAEELFGPEETLHATFQALRDELLGDVQRTARGLSELRFDTDLDVTHAVARYLEILKVAALLQRPAGQSVADALPGINQHLLSAVSPLQREVLVSSTLDDVLVDAERDDRARAAARAARAEPSLEAFLPRRGEGLALSAGDIETYRSCPLRYKFARVLRIPQEPTLHQRFGILIHQVLERYHQTGGHTVDELLDLLQAGWRRGGFGDREEERQLHVKATDSLRRYHDRVRSERVDPVWFERGFTFRMGRHTVRGRVDRVDRLAEGGFELIDYKTGRPRTVADLREDVQLSLYAIGAREAWNLESAEQAYLYVLDDEKVRVPTEEMDPDWITETVLEVADAIQGQGFEPTPSFATCARCDYRIACPAAER